MTRETQHPISRFWSLLKPDGPDIKRVYFYSILVGFINLSLPLGIQSIINFVQTGQVSTSLVLLIAMVVAGILAIGVLQIFQLQITETLQRKIFARAALEFTFRVPRIKLDELYKKYAPELMNRFFDVLTIQKGLPKLLIDFASAALQIIFCLILLSFYHPFFILFSLVLILVVWVFFAFTGKRGLESSILESKYKYKLLYWLQSYAQMHVHFKMLGSSNIGQTNTQKEVGNYLDAREKHFNVLLTQYRFVVAIKILISFALLAIGGALVLNNQMNLGQFVAAEILILLLLAAVEKMLLSMDVVYDVLTALDKIGAVVDLELEKMDGLILDYDSTIGFEINLDNVSFTYPESKHPTINQINLKINAGEKIILKGGNGSGKTTLMTLIASNFKISDGFIQINNVPLSNLNINTYRSFIGDCVSPSKLLNETIMENIVMGRENINRNEVAKIAEEIGLNQYISKLPLGYDTLVGHIGHQIPKSVIVKIVLLRNTIQQPKLVLVDDIFSILSIEEQTTIYKYILNKDKPWTVVSTCNSAIADALADKIVFLDNGTIIKEMEVKNA